MTRSTHARRLAAIGLGLGTVLAAGREVRADPETVHWADAHFRPLLLGLHVAFHNPDPTLQTGGMILTLPLGVELDIAVVDLDARKTRTLKIGSVGLFGPGVNWVGFSHNRPWYPGVVGAISLSIMQLGFRLDPPTKEKPDPSELVFGAGFDGVATGQVLNQDSHAGDGLTWGFLVKACYTPAGL